MVDLWAGLRDREQGQPWEADTMAMIFSTTKGLSAIALAVAHSRGLVELDQPVGRYWPEKAGAGRLGVVIVTMETVLHKMEGADPTPLRWREAVWIWTS